MTERSYKLGKRDKQYRPRKETFGDGTWAFHRNNLGQFVITVNENDKAPGPDIKLFLRIEKATNVYLMLTSLTEEELVTLREILNDAIDWSIPVARARDKEAQDAFEAGDDSHVRIYRQVPQLVYRKRPDEEHMQGVFHRPEDVSSVGEDADDLDGGLRGSGDDVAERDQGDDESQDNWPTPHQPPSLREVGEDARDAQ